jgi:hypothetical protein
MVLAWTLTVAGFIIIFVDVGGWVSESVSENPHPLIGCITTSMFNAAYDGLVLRATL